MTFKIEFSRTRRHNGQAVLTSGSTVEDAVKKAKQLTGYRKVSRAYKIG